MWVLWRVITLCGCSAGLSHCVGAVQSYHIVWVQWRVITLCECSAELSQCVGAVHNYHIVWVQWSYNIVWMQYSYHIVWVQCRVITLCECSAEISHCVGVVQSYHIPSWNCVVQFITSQLFFKGSIRHFEKEPYQHNRRYTLIGKRKDGLAGLCHQFHLTDPESFVSQTPKISSHRPQHFHLTDPKILS